MMDIPRADQEVEVVKSGYALFRLSHLASHVFASRSGTSDYGAVVARDT
jgi:hypothetical protein